jgi:RNA polymerase sigma factor (sigma-70 family)
MHEMDDIELLQRYVRERDEACFTTLVERHLGLVHSTALRQVRDPHLAEEVTQAVFIILAKKAHAFRQGVVISSWLYRTTRFAASDALKSQYRRLKREQEAFEMDTSSADNSAWVRIEPMLEDAMARLNHKDRDVLILRYFEDRPLAAVGTALGIKEGAARKRVDRALQKLRAFFARRGTIISAVTLGSVLSANAVQAAPAILGPAVAKAALMKGVASTGSILAIVKGTISTMAWIKLKATAWASARLMLVAGIAVGTTMEIQDYRLSKEDPAKPFRDFLEQHPDIKRIEFSVDHHFFHYVTEPGEQEPVDSSPRGMVHFVGGKQGESFYIRQINDGSVQGTAFASPGGSGKSRDYFWSINTRNNAAIMTSREDNRIEPFVRDAANRLWQMLTLEIPGLKYGTLHWADHTNFTAVSLQNRKMQGRIAQFYTNGLPKRIECEVEGDPPQTMRGVEFKYAPDRMPPGIPCQFAHTGTVKGKPYSSPYQNQIENLELGKDSISELGYIPSDFMQFAGGTGGPVRYRRTLGQQVDWVATRLYSASRGELLAGAGLVLGLLIGIPPLRRALSRRRD